MGRENRRRSGVLVSCEHASNRLPPGYDAPDGLMDLHIAWDPGALDAAEAIGGELGAPLHKGEYSRLIVDLNRTIGNSRLIRRVSDGHRIPFNRRLDRAEIENRIERFYRPYRDAVLAGVSEIVRERGRCIHLCIHTFTPVLRGKVRGNDIGLLYDPRRAPEAAAIRELRPALAERTGLVVWLNRPYQGTADGILPRLREVQGPDRYVAIELEINQKHAEQQGRMAEIATDFCRCLREISALGIEQPR